MYDHFHHDFTLLNTAAVCPTHVAGWLADVDSKLGQDVDWVLIDRESGPSIKAGKNAGRPSLESQRFYI